ncbi:MAG: DsbA family protein [Pseudomonadota bacterium]|nr:DsbA family protein [Pseudomonadota bacterium]
MNENNKTPWLAAIGGGIVGAALTAGGLMLAAPSLLGERMVRDALVSKPEIIVEAGEALRDRQYAETLRPIRASLERPFFSSWKGAEKPDVILTYFYDYACGYCRTSNPDIERLLKEDKGLRVVYREFPILGPESVAAARVSLAASKAGKFAQYHDALYAAGRPGPDTIALAAKSAGVPAQPVEDPAQEAELRANMTLASQLGATGTPLFVVGDRVINSAVGYEGLKQAVEAARKKG